MKMIPGPSIAVVPLHLVIRNSEFRAVGDTSLAVVVRFEGVGFSAARLRGILSGCVRCWYHCRILVGWFSHWPLSRASVAILTTPDRWSVGLRLYSPPFAHIECTDAVKCGPPRSEYGF